MPLLRMKSTKELNYDKLIDYVAKMKSLCEGEYSRRATITASVEMMIFRVTRVLHSNF